MRKWLFFFIILSLSGCTDQKNDSTETEQYKEIRLPDASEAQGKDRESGYIENMPNAETVTETVELNSGSDSQALINALQEKLKKNGFSLSASRAAESWAVNDCRKNKILKMTGQGVSSFYAESHIGIGSRKDYYPDFLMYVFTFSDSAQADRYFGEISSALVSGGGFCNGKAPDKLVQNGTQLFYLTTRAEMFRGYINQYAEVIQSFKK
ncbi:hypothetical protein QR674_00120 [Acinetobacter chinensis]|uniref:Lipoprotein n=1 Tax=Acinetobacter chinensis TaxID=2004650 RepID=A0ABU3WAG3_9GAMM|nr:hypothetical protein [Acinetobacter chinensis]MDV2467395.1 hypothetical protein [Acinetobacter chinensis]